jgi:hypothetical protein
LVDLFLESLFLVSGIGSFTPFLIFSEIHLWGYRFFYGNMLWLSFWHLPLKFEQIEFLKSNCLLLSELYHTLFQVHLRKCFPNVMVNCFRIEKIVLMVINNHLSAFKIIEDITVHSS